MKITIDTKEDSPTDIRKVIALLSKMIEDSSERRSNIFEDSGSSLGNSDSSDEEKTSEPAGVNAFANMFGNSDSGSSSVDDTPVLGSAEEKKEKEEEEPVSSIIEY